jgi:hypothetical protein
MTTCSIIVQGAEKETRLPAKMWREQSGQKVKTGLAEPLRFDAPHEILLYLVVEDRPDGDWVVARHLVSPPVRAGDPILLAPKGWHEVDSQAHVALRTVDLKEFPPTARMAHVWALVAPDAFPSVKQAKKAGWDFPILTGTWKAGNHYVRITRTEDT